MISCGFRRAASLLKSPLVQRICPRRQPKFDRVASATLRASPQLLGPSGAARAALRGDQKSTSSRRPRTAAPGALLDAAMLLRHVYEADGPGVARFCTATGRKASP